jgi:hypothetical protein
MIMTFHRKFLKSRKVAALRRVNIRCIRHQVGQA